MIEQDLPRSACVARGNHPVYFSVQGSQLNPCIVEHRLDLYRPLLPLPQARRRGRCTWMLWTQPQYLVVPLLGANGWSRATRASLESHQVSGSRSHIHSAFSLDMSCIIIIDKSSSIEICNHLFCLLFQKQCTKIPTAWRIEALAIALIPAIITLP